MPDIDFQRIVLNLIPKQGDEPVVFYASQYETTRPFIADLMWGDTEFAPGDSCWAEIDIRKNDDNLVVITDDVSIDNNEVSVILPVQAVTCIGKNLGQVKIYAGDDQLIAALNFILEVQPDPLAGGVTSETAIDNLTTQIEEIAQAEGYLKTEDVAPVALSGSYNDLTDKPTIPDDLSELTDVQITTPDYKDALFYDDVYQKWVNEPAYTKSDIQMFYYDKTAVDTALSAKADASSVYTKTQVEGLINALLPVGSATGNPCTFDTALIDRLYGLIADIVSSGGGGTPSTPVPIVGHSALNLDVNGDTFTVNFGQTVYGGVYEGIGRLTITWYGVDLGSLEWNYTSALQIFYTYLDNRNNIPDKKIGRENVKCSIYQPTTNEYVDMLDGEMRGTDDSAGFNVKDLRYSDITSFTAAMSGIILAYELDTPIVIDVTSISANTVLGTNTITSDCNGDVTVSYKDTIQHYIDERT